MSTHERKASIREFYGISALVFLNQVWVVCILAFVGCWRVEFMLWAAVIYPSLLQLEKGVTDTEDKKQKVVCMERYRRRDDEEYRQSSDIDIEREDECGICMDMNSKIVLPNCNHAMCLKCYREWYSPYLLNSLSLPLCACVFYLYDTPFSFTSKKMCDCLTCFYYRFDALFSLTINFV